MKSSTLHIGILSILLTTSLSSEGKESKPGGGVVGLKVKGMHTQGGRAVSRGSENAVRAAETDAAREVEQGQNAVPTAFFSRSGEEALPLKIVNQTNSISTREADSIINTLATRIEISADMKSNIKKVLTENPDVGLSAKLLAEKMQDPKTSSEKIKTEDLQTIVEYLAQVKNMEYGPRNEEHPSNENILMDLAINAMEMATWKENPRSNATSLLKEISGASKTQPTITGALDVALQNRGYETPEARRRRKQEIRENCRK